MPQIHFYVLSPFWQHLVGILLAARRFTNEPKALMHRASVVFMLDLSSQSRKANMFRYGPLAMVEQRRNESGMQTYLGF